MFTTVPAPESGQTEERDFRPQGGNKRPQVSFQGDMPKAPFAQATFLFLLRFAMVIVPFLYGLYLVQEWWKLLYRYRGAFYYDLGFPWWLVWISIIALGTLGTVIWIFVCYDLVRSPQIIGQWQRKNIYRLGKFIKCVESGRLGLKIPIFESWSSTIDMRRRVTRWSANLIMTSDDVLVDLSMTLDYTVNPEHPERSEIEVKDLDQFVQTKAETVTKSVAGKYSLAGLQGGAADEEFRKGLQEKVGDLVTIHYMGITDTNYSPETANALASKAIQKAEAEGRRDARRIDKETTVLSLEMLELLREHGMSAQAGDAALALQYLDYYKAMGDEGKGIYVLGVDAMAKAISQGQTEVVSRLIEQFGKKASSQEGEGGSS